jgi:hypothetical protein
LLISACRLPIGVETQRAFSIGNWQSPIENLAGSFLAALSRAGRKRASFTLAQLGPGGSALKRLFIRTQSGSSINREHTFNFRVWTRNDVNTNQLPHPSGSRRSSVRRRLYRAYVSTHENRHIPGADILFSEERNVSRFDHGVSSLNGSNETFGLNHSECF